MGRPLRITSGRARLCVTTIAVLSIAACSGQKAATSADPAAPTGKRYSLEQIAAQTDCRMQLQSNVAEFRQGACKTTAGRYVVLTFATQQGGDDWLKEAKNWGGTYLVGPRWVVVGTPQQLQSFRSKLGGSIQAGDDHSGSGHTHAPTSGH
ncbi:MAG: hypothetical protein QOE54_5788 [Streptosporangiaceae bacterium]|nr:hypothetical protein [Streptosporangiaceae bacterium]